MKFQNKLGILYVVLYAIMLYALKCTLIEHEFVDSYNAEIWQINSLTISNFTIEVTISDAIWNFFKKQLEDDQDFRLTHELAENQSVDEVF